MNYINFNEFFNEFSVPSGRIPDEQNERFCMKLYEQDFPVLQDIDGIGSTGYLDSLPKSAMSAPVMTGIDKHGRRFIALRLSMTSNLGPEFEEDNEYAMVIFQRYSDQTKVWTFAHGQGLNSKSAGYIVNPDYILSLIKGETVVIESYGEITTYKLV